MITRHGRPVAELMPAPPQVAFPFGVARNSRLVLKEIIGGIR